MSDQPRGYVRTMQDVKTLVLFVLSHLEQPISMTRLYELCFQDDRLSYFDLAIAVPELIASGHVLQPESAETGYAISDLGRADEAVLETDLPLSLRTRCLEAIGSYCSELRRSEHRSCQIEEREDGLYNVVMVQQSAMGQLMRIELMAPNLNQARVIEQAWQSRSETVLKSVMAALTGKQQEG